MVDVTIPYKGDADAFVIAKREKFSKYNDLVAWVCQNYSSVSFHTLIVGTLVLQHDVKISGSTLQIHSSFQIFDLSRWNKGILSI